MARVQILREVSSGKPGDWVLCFQRCLYLYDEADKDGYNSSDGAKTSVEEGYRFIWRRPDGSLQAARGQTRLPSISLAKSLMDCAIAQGWGDFSDSRHQEITAAYPNPTDLGRMAALTA